MSPPGPSGDAPPQGLTGESHPELFSERPPKGNKPGQLTQEQLDEFYAKGYLLVKDFFKTEELLAVRADVEAKVTELADKLFAAGKIKDKCENLGFFERLIGIEKQFPGSNVILHKLAALPPSFKKIAQHELLLNMMEDILGPNIAFNPVWNLRTKTPNNLATTVPWHQDCGYLDNEAYKVLMVTAWIPLLDADEVNGTLEMVPGCHKEAKVVKHTCCAGPTWYVMLEEEEMKNSFGVDVEKQAEIIPVPFGSLLLFNNFTPHRSLNNRSENVRWSLDFRWQRSGTAAGLYGLKQPCDVRRNGDSSYQPDWVPFDSVDRNQKQNEAMSQDSDEFSTVVSGPWMHKWEIVNHNRHTDAFDENPETWDPSTLHG